MKEKEVDLIRLKRIAHNQRQLCLCILLLIIGLLAHIILFKKGWTVGGLGDPSIATFISWGINFYAAILVILLTSNVYNSRLLGVVLGILCFIPAIGILFLLGINQQATKLLKANGTKVGFFGAKNNQFN